MKVEKVVVTSGQIAEWKKKHGSIFSYTTVDGLTAYFKRPDRKIISYATVTAGSDHLLQKELVIKNIFIGGNKEVYEEDKYFYALANKIESVIETIEGELKEV